MVAEECFEMVARHAWPGYQSRVFILLLREYGTVDDCEWHMYPIVHSPETSSTSVSSHFLSSIDT